jgi:ribonuclease P/MRP protein subunit RPP40
VWNPWTEKDCETLEKVQRRAVKMVSNLQGETYEEKLESAGLTRLKDRRKRGDMIETFKIMSRFSKSDKRTWFEVQEKEDYEGRRTRTNMRINEEGKSKRRENVIKGRKSRTDLQNSFFSQRVCSDWNGLPHKVKAASSVNAFKNHHVKLILESCTAIRIQENIRKTACKQEVHKTDC